MILKPDRNSSTGIVSMFNEGTVIAPVENILAMQDKARGCGKF